MPPQDVFGRARPLLAHQVVDLEARQAAAERLAQVRARDFTPSSSRVARVP